MRGRSQEHRIGRPPGHGSGNVPVAVKVPSELLAVVDAAAVRVGLCRAAWCASAVACQVGRDREGISNSDGYDVRVASDMTTVTIHLTLGIATLVDLLVEQMTGSRPHGGFGCGRSSRSWYARRAFDLQARREAVQRAS